MNRTERLYALLDILRSRRSPVERAELCQQLECSYATLKRILKTLREQYKAPIRCQEGRYFLERDNEHCELPGLWLSAAELSALLVINELLSRLGLGLLKTELEPFRQRIEQLLNAINWPQGSSGAIVFPEVGVRVWDPQQFGRLPRACGRKASPGLPGPVRTVDADRFGPGIPGPGTLGSGRAGVSWACAPRVFFAPGKGSGPQGRGTRGVGKSPGETPGGLPGRLCFWGPPRMGGPFSPCGFV